MLDAMESSAIKVEQQGNLHPMRIRTRHFIFHCVWGITRGMESHYDFLYFYQKEYILM